MDMKLSGKRALVTGSSSGIGAAAAEMLAAEGARVIVHGRNADRAQAVADRITAAGGEAAIALGDVATEEGADAIMAAAVARWGGVDILVNNAGGVSNPGVNWDNIEAEDWLRTYQHNAVSATRMIKRCVPGMKAGGWGRIIQMASLAAVRNPPVIPDYNSTKAALHVMTVSLSKALAGTGITVNSISPGIIVTAALQSYFLNFPENAGKSWEEVEGELMKSYNNLVKRLGRPEDVGAAVVFLASGQADNITGANLRVDGGMAGTAG